MAGYWSGAQIYIALALVILAILAAVSWRGRKQEPPQLSKLAAVAFALLIAGMIFGERRAIGYILLGAGVALAVVDMYRKNKKKRD